VAFEISLQTRYALNRKERAFTHKRSEVMKRHLVLFALIGLSIFFFASLNVAKDQETCLTGTWDCQSKGGANGDIPFTLYLQQDGEKVDGSVASPLGDAPISVGTFKQGVLEFEISTPDGSYVLTAKLDNGALSGKWTYGAEKGTWEGNKQGSEAK
jgi:hypothetical protein